LFSKGKNKNKNPLAMSAAKDPGEGFNSSCARDRHRMAETRHPDSSGIICGAR